MDRAVRQAPRPTLRGVLAWSNCLTPWTGHATMTPNPSVPSVPLASAVSRTLSRTAWLRLTLIAAVLLPVLLATLFGEPGPRYLGDPALATLLRGMAAVKGLIALGAFAALWWRAAWPGPVRLGIVAVAGVAAQVAATVWIARLVAIPWAAGLFDVGLALTLASAWLEHRREGNGRAVAFRR